MQSRICTYKPLNVKKPYNLRKAAYVAKRCTQMRAKDVQPTQSRIQLRNQTAIEVFEKNNK